MANLQSNKDIKQYNYGEVITPYQLKTQQWDFPLGRYQAAAAKWRYGAFISLSVSVLFALLFILLLSLPKQQVFAVQTTKNGFVSEVYRLDRHYQIPVSLYEQFIGHYVKSVLSVTLSSERNRRNQLFAEWFSHRKVINALRQGIHILPSGQRELVMINRIESLPSSKKGVRYRVIWQQGRLMPGQGEPKQLRRRQAIFTIGNRMPVHQRQILINPFGFYVENVTGLDQQQSVSK
mgnify:CR=1 FL=1